MPTYIYKNLETGEIYELKQSMKDDAYTHHPESGVAIKRLVAKPAIVFKGSGFYANDSRANNSGKTNNVDKGESGQASITNKVESASSKKASQSDSASKAKAES